MKFEDMINSVVCGDCLEVMKNIPDNSIDMVLTSPPYDNLRAYKGYIFDFENIAKELYRVVKKGGVVVWVVGDATIKGSETGTSLRQALYFKEIGFNLHDTMIYKKKNPVPLNHNRYEQCFEYMFILSKKKPRVFNPILESCIHSGKDISKNRRFYQSSGSKTSDGHTNHKTNKQKIKQNIFEYPLRGGQKKYKHPAVFPEKLANDHIISWSNEGDIVLDPMCGSGTTCKMALKNNRKYIGIDISEEYCKLVIERIRETQSKLKDNK